VARAGAQLVLVVILASIATIMLLRLSRPKNSHWNRFIVALLVLGIADLLALYPLPVPPLDLGLEARAYSLPPRVGVPTAIVLGEPRHAKDFYSSDWSYAWTNLLEQEVCSYNVVDLDTLEAIPNWTKVLIVTRGAMVSAGTKADDLSAWVAEGNLLILEFPSLPLFQLAGVSGEEPSKIRRPKRVTWADDPSGQLLLPMPLETDLLSASEGPDVEVLMRMDGRPAVLYREHGEGAVITFLFDVGRQLTALQQGVPDFRFRVKDKRGSHGIVDATDLLLSPELLTAFVPYADVLERWVIAAAERFLPLPRVWYFEYPFDGLVAVTHDEEWYGDQSIFIFEEEAAQGYPSTFFVIPKGPITSRGLHRMKQLGPDIEIHWNRELTRRLVFFRMGDGTLRSQIRTLIKKLGRGSDAISLCRIHRLRWGGHYTRTYRIMERQGIKMDLSLGPAGLRGKGYLFGTGLPFHPLDTNGRPFRLYELPIHVESDYSNADSEYLGQLLENSSSSFHEVIDVLYHPLDLVEGRPTRQYWLELRNLSLQENHKLVTVSALLDWWRERCATNISNLTWKDGRLSFDFHAKSEDVAIMIPVSVGKRSLYEIRADGGPCQERRVSLQGKAYLLVKAAPGTRKITALFG